MIVIDSNTLMQLALNPGVAYIPEHGNWFAVTLAGGLYIQPGEFGGMTAEELNDFIRRAFAS